MSKAQTLKTRAGDIVLDARKVAYLPSRDTLLVADMHFEKGSYLQEYGRSTLPAFDTHDTIERLWAIAQDYKPSKIIALGDSFHDTGADLRMTQKSIARLNQLRAINSEIIWVLGNHDPDIPAGILGEREDHVQAGDFLLTHHPHSAGNGVNICGHYHPKAKISSRAGSVTSPCFAVSKGRIIMPSFGTYTGGLFVSDPAFIEAMPDLDLVVLTYQDRLFPIAARAKA